MVCQEAGIQDPRCTSRLMCIDVLASFVIGRKFGVRPLKSKAHGLVFAFGRIYTVHEYASMFEMKYVIQDWATGLVVCRTCAYK